MEKITADIRPTVWNCEQTLQWKKRQRRDFIKMSAVLSVSFSRRREKIVLSSDSFE